MAVDIQKQIPIRMMRTVRKPEPNPPLDGYILPKLRPPEKKPDAIGFNAHITREYDEEDDRQ